MANIVAERSAIGDFLDELPGLLMQYQQMKWQMEDRALDRESRKVERAQGIALQQFYNKQEEVKRTEAMYDKYQGISPSEMTDGGISLLNMVDEKNNIDTKAITDNLDRLSSYQSDLMTGLNELRGQSTTLRKMQSEYAGAEGVLQEHEYKEFQEGALKSIEEGGLGWTTTAGADLAFYETDPTAREDLAFRMSERYTKDAKIGAAGSYGLVQSVILPKEGETSVDPDDLEYVDQITGKRVTPTEEMANEMHSMGLQGDYDDFMNNLYAYEMLNPEKGAQIRSFLESNPNTARSFSNLEKDYTAIKTLERDLAGINTPEPVNAYNNFVDNISGVTNKDALFSLYQDAINTLPVAEHAQYFEALEGQLGVEDAYPEYQSWLGPDIPQPVDSSGKTPETLGEKAMTIPIIGAMGWTKKKVDELMYNMGVDIYNLGAVPLNYLTTFLTGTNPGFKGTTFMEPAREALGLTEKDMEGFPYSFYKDLNLEGGTILGIPEGQSAWNRDVEEALNTIVIDNRKRK